MEQLTRSAKVTFEIISGKEVIERGCETARKLWNYTRWCVIGYNEKLRLERGDSWERYKRNRAYNRTGEKYPGRFTLIKELKNYWAGRELSDKAYQAVISEFDIAMRSWFSYLKSNPKAGPPRYAQDSRQLTFVIALNGNAKPVGEWTYRLTVLGECIKDRHAIVRIRLAPGIKMAQVKLIRVQPDLTGTIVYYVNQKQATGTNLAGIDLGIINIATVAFNDGSSILYSGKGLLDSDRYYQKRAAKCKPKNWEKGKAESRQSKRNAAYRVKAGNVRKLAIHNLTTDIIRQCVSRGVGTIVIGDLTGILEDKDYGGSTNQKLHNWPFAEIRRQIEYKALEQGIEVIAVSERNTSKCCHICGCVGKRNPRGLLTCTGCGVEINSDVNGAFGILNKVSLSGLRPWLE